MRRRELLGTALVLAPFPAFRSAVQSNLPIIGYFSARTARVEAPLREPFLEELERSGFVAGQNVKIEYRFAEGQRDRLPIIAAELVGLPVAVLVATEPGAGLAAKAATSAIPLLFTSGYDPVEAGLVAGLRRPGGNATGVSLFTSELGPKRLELLRELLGQPGPIAFLTDAASPSAEVQRQAVQAAGQALKQPILPLEIRSRRDFEAAFATMAARGVVGLLYGASTVFQASADTLIALAAQYRLPAVYEWPQFVRDGGLISYSTSRAEIGRILGDYAGRILKGAAPSELPVLQSARFELAINVKTAKTLGLAVPQSLLARADEVIE